MKNETEKKAPPAPKRKRELPPADDVTPPPGAPGMPGGPPMPKYAKGGYTRSADGIAKKGKTRGRYI